MSEVGIKMTKTFSSFDKYGLEPFANQLTTFLQVESKFVDESYVLSLNSEFGSGKSTFFEMWISNLKSVGNIFEVVYLNAWESDFQGDPLLAIVSCLLNILQPPDASKDVKEIKETAGKLGKFALSIGNDFVQKITGIDVIKAGQYAESKDGIAKPKSGSACFQLYQEKQELFEKLKTLLHDFTTKSEHPILVIIDELDRCRPNYAIEFLETIKHFFNIKGLIFVLGVDKSQLASSAKALFGQELVFDEYYRKFAHRNINLPVKSEPMTSKFCRELVEEYLSQEAFAKKNRFSYARHDSYRSDNIVDICETFALNARQIHEFFRITAYVLSMTKESDSYLLWGWQIGTYFMVALSIKNHDIYDKLGSRTISLSEFTAFLKKLTLFNKDKHDSYWWAALLYLGAFNDQPADKVKKEFQELGVWISSDKEEKTFQDDLYKFFSDAFRARREQIFSYIYEILEGLRTLAR